MTYCGFNAEALNSRQPIPKKKAIIYFTSHEPWAVQAAQGLRDKFGVNVWLDGTVCTGWKILVHAADADRVNRMFLSLL